MSKIKPGDKVRILEVLDEDSILNARIGSIATVIAQEAISMKYILRYVDVFDVWTVGGASESSIEKLSDEELPYEVGDLLEITQITHKDALHDATVGTIVEIYEDFDGETYPVIYTNREGEIVYGYVTPGSVELIDFDSDFPPLFAEDYLKLESAEFGTIFNENTSIISNSSIFNPDDWEIENNGFGFTFTKKEKKKEEESVKKPKVIPIEIRRKVLLAEQDDNLAWLWEALESGNEEMAQKSTKRLGEIHKELEELK